MLKLTQAEAARLIERLPAAQREAIEEAMTNSGAGSKFGNRFVIVDGTLFHSEGEYARFCDLKIEERARSIKNLKRQVPFTVTCSGRKMFTWFADFTYERQGKEIVEDFKGFLTPLYKLKKRFVEALFEIKIFESRARARRQK
jgi:hypothetical protein